MTLAPGSGWSAGKIEDDSGTDKNASPARILHAVFSPNESIALPQSRDEFRRCRRSQQRFSRFLEPKRSGQGADADQVIVHHLLRHCDDEDQVDQIFRSVKRYPVFAPSDPEHDLVNKFGPRMWVRDPVIRHRRAFLLALHHRFEERLRLPQFAALVHQLDDFPNRFARGAALQFGDEIFWIEKAVEQGRASCVMN